jgi:hypothetical protein
MTILYMADLTVDSSDFADFLRGEDDTHVSFVDSAYEVEEWAENDDEVVIILFENGFEKEAERLKGRFVTIERKPDMDPDDVFKAIEQAFPNLSPRIQ